MTTANVIGPVVVGVDGSEPSIQALRHGIAEAAWRGVAVHVVHVLDVTPAVLHLAGNRTLTTRELAESDRQEIWKLVDPHLDASAIEVVRVNRDGNPAETLCRYAREVDASAIVVGPRGRGMLVEALLGSTAHAVIKDADRDVLVVKRGVSQPVST
jgi:nucleotide-binding universal stress UspA family protein